MKSIFIAFDLAHYNKIIDILDRNNCRGFTAWEHVSGRGSVDGEPHYGSHAWPSLASAIMTVVEDSRVPIVLDRLRKLNESSPRLGLRAFVWDITQSI